MGIVKWHELCIKANTQEGESHLRLEFPELVLFLLFVFVYFLLCFRLGISYPLGAICINIDLERQGPCR